MLNLNTFDGLKFFRDYNIDHVTSGNAHCTAGWVQIHCPFCIGSRDYHLGMHIDTGAFSCWRCGKHKQIEVVEALLSVDFNEAKRIIREYRNLSSETLLRPYGDQKFVINKPKICQLPEGTGVMQQRHRKYLETRKFDAEMLEQVWGLKGTGIIGRYKHRVIIPITLKQEVVSYQGRDITGQSALKYKACAIKDEVVHHKDILYGIDFVKNRRAVIVEGVADAWRLGKGACCTFGTSYTTTQVNFICDRLDEVFVLYDGLADDANAFGKAKKLTNILSMRGLKVELLELDEGDPAEMKQDDADYLMKELGI